MGNSLFVAKAWRTSLSDASGDVALVWQTTVGQSAVLRLLPSEIFHFENLVTLLWLFMAMQITYALLLTVPISPPLNSKNRTAWRGAWNQCGEKPKKFAALVGLTEVPESFDSFMKRIES